MRPVNQIRIVDFFRLVPLEEQGHQAGCTGKSAQTKETDRFGVGDGRREMIRPGPRGTLKYSSWGFTTVKNTILGNLGKMNDGHNTWITVSASFSLPKSRAHAQSAVRVLASSVNMALRETVLRNPPSR